MKNILFKIILSVALILTCNKVFAQNIEITYSDWSMLYPSGISEVFIESETRYHFYKIENGEVIYDDEYLTEKAGYTKDESSARTFFRYITNDKLVFNAKNEMVTDMNHCQKNFCYLVKNEVKPIMMDISEKDVQDYDTENIEVINKTAVPFTGDNIVYYLIGLVFSIGLIVFVYKSKKDKSYN